MTILRKISSYLCRLSSRKLFPGTVCSRCVSSSVPHGQGLATEEKKEKDVDPLEHEDYFDVRKLVTLKDLYNNNVHFGHAAGCRNDYMKPYIFGTRIETDIIDLEQTLPLFQDALNFVAHMAYRRAVILFVSRSKAIMPYVEKTAQECGEFAHCRYWQPGLFTDTSNLFGHQVRLPELCIFLNTQNSVFQTHKGVIDCAKLLVPTVGIVDTNCDPRLITYPIPGNDDTFKTMLYYLRLFETAVKKGKERRRLDDELRNV